MKGLNCSVIGSKLAVSIEAASLNGGGVQQYRCNVTVDEEWDGLQLFATFEFFPVDGAQSPISREVVDGSCIIPDSALLAGRMTVGIRGISPDLEATTNRVSIVVAPGIGSGVDGDVPSPSIWAQYIFEVEELVEEAREAAKGMPGEPGQPGKDGQDAIYALEIDTAGDLYLVYSEGTEPPDMTIDAAGDLYLEVD